MLWGRGVWGPLLASPLLPWDSLGGLEVLYSPYGALMGAGTL